MVPEQWRIVYKIMAVSQLHPPSITTSSAQQLFNNMTLLEFTQSYTMPKELGAAPNKRKVVVITRPYCSPDPAELKYEQYCQQSLMKHKSFRQVTNLLAGHETYAQAYAEFLQTGDIPPSLEEDIFRLQQYQEQANADEVHVHLSHTCMYIYMFMLNLTCNV